MPKYDGIDIHRNRVLRKSLLGIERRGLYSSIDEGDHRIEQWEDEKEACPLVDRAGLRLRYLDFHAAVEFESYAGRITLLCTLGRSERERDRWAT